MSDLFALLVQIVTVIALWAIIGELFRRGLIALAKRAGASRQLVRNIRDGIRIAWIVVAVAAVLIVTGVASEFQALTLTGLAGLAISLALQTTLSNIIAGVLLFSDKTLRLNDVISYSGIKGTVVRVGLRSTLIRTQEGNIAIIGNSTLMSGPFINYSAEERLVGKP
ncbi:MAG TPA: mechanosensitive ion channel domain-containing protein [Candidatus Bathyarchaeia archaeon]|nr:mechanosensitive ion channel domain-containing protein [Candidatus Bathyarchaeia archaeon]